MAYQLRAWLSKTPWSWAAERGVSAVEIEHGVHLHPLTPTAWSKLGLQGRFERSMDDEANFRFFETVLVRSDSGLQAYLEISSWAGAAISAIFVWRDGKRVWSGYDQDAVEIGLGHFLEQAPPMPREPDALRAYFARHSGASFDRLGLGRQRKTEDWRAPGGVRSAP